MLRGAVAVAHSLQIDGVLLARPRDVERLRVLETQVANGGLGVGDALEVVLVPLGLVDAVVGTVFGDGGRDGVVVRSGVGGRSGPKPCWREGQRKENDALWEGLESMDQK